VAFFLLPSDRKNLNAVLVSFGTRSVSTVALFILNPYIRTVVNI
jgi:hypothetical protein